MYAVFFFVLNLTIIHNLDYNVPAKGGTYFTPEIHLLNLG